MENQNNGTIINGEGQNAVQAPEKKGLKAFLGVVRRKYDAIRYSKYGKIGAKLLTLAAIGETANVAYKKGKASVKPTVVTIEKIPETEAPAEEAPAEETVVEETV